MKNGRSDLVKQMSIDLGVILAALRSRTSERHKARHPGAADSPASPMPRLLCRA